MIKLVEWVWIVLCILSMPLSAVKTNWTMSASVLWPVASSNSYYGDHSGHFSSEKPRTFSGNVVFQISWTSWDLLSDNVDKNIFLNRHNTFSIENITKNNPMKLQHIFILYSIIYYPFGRLKTLLFLFSFVLKEKKLIWIIIIFVKFSSPLALLSFSCSGKVFSPPPSLSPRRPAATTIFLTRKNLENTRKTNNHEVVGRVQIFHLHVHYPQKKHIH